jgi:hypothetical protein
VQRERSWGAEEAEEAEEAEGAEGARKIVFRVLLATGEKLLPPWTRG